MSHPTTFFPPIGAVAEKADALPETDDQKSTEAPADSEESLIQETESLCMKCGEQVCTHI